MRMDHLKIIVQIADCGSITAAAEKLHLSQPNVSIAVNSLEEELKTRIFLRSRLGTHPTETGKLVIQQAREILFHIEKIKSIENDASLLSGTLSILTVPSMCTTILPKTVGTFKRKFPNVQIDIIEEGTMQIQESILKGEVNIGLGSQYSKFDFDPILDFIPLLSTKVMACVSRHSELAHKKNLSYADIIQYPIVILNQEYTIHHHTLSILNKFGNPNILLTARNPASIKGIILEGLAVGFDFEIALKTDPYVQNGDIIPMLINEERQPTHFGIWHIKEHQTSVSEEFIKELKVQANTFSRLFNLEPI